VLVVLAVLVVVAFATASADAATATVGEVSLTPNLANLDSTGLNIPVFQGDASGNYVLTAPHDGTITSWSFLSGGASTGSMFVLRRLQATDGTGENWRALGTSAAVAVTTATGTDAVNGPFATSIAVSAGDRIALQPVNGLATPIEQGVSGADGIRYFSTPFADGSSSMLAAGATADNGQVVPIQATETYNPPPPSASPTEVLTITATGSGSGTVSGSAMCRKASVADTTCHASFPYGTVVTLTAKADTGSTFVGWLFPGDMNCVLGTCSIVMTGDESVTSVFEAPQTLTTTVDGAGEGFVSDVPERATGREGSSGSICTKAGFAARTCTKQYAYDAEPTLRAVPTHGYQFTGWSGACSGTGTCTVLMNEPRSVTATFGYDAGVHVNGIEITQGIQTTELPTRTTPAGYAVSYRGVPISSNGGSGTAPVTVTLAQDHATVVRVYVNTQRARRGEPAPSMRLIAYRSGKMLAPGPIGPDISTRLTSRLSGPSVPVGPLGSVTSAQQFSVGGAYTFTLPWGWAEGTVSFIADTNPQPGMFPAKCPDTDCLDRGIELQNVDFHPVSFAQIDPIAITVNGNGPQGFKALIGPQVDPALVQVQDLVPFPIYTAPYVAVVNGTNAALGCDGVTQGSLTNSQFGQAVYAAQDTALLQYVKNWAGLNNTSSSIIPFGLLAKVTTSNCANSFGQFSGGLSNGAVLYSSAQPDSVASDDRPITGIAHEFHHDIGLPHAGQQCGSGSVGTALTLTGTTTVNSATLTVATAGLAPGQPIIGPNVPSGTEILTVGATSITMTAKATATNTGSFQFTTGLGQTGSTWPPTQVASSGIPADGFLDGVGLVGLDDPANSPYEIRGPAVPGTAGQEFYDLMSYCTGGNDALGWISVKNWNYDAGFDAPAPTAVGGDAARDASVQPTTPALRAVANRVPSPPTAARTFPTDPPPSVAATRTLDVSTFFDVSSGRAVSTSVTPDLLAPTPNSAHATYTLAGRDAAGSLVTSAGTVTSLLHDDPGPGHRPSAIVMIEGRLPAARVREVDVLQNGTPVAQVHASAHAPTAAFVSLRRGARIGGIGGETFRWRSRDADGNALQVTLDFSPNNGRTWTEIYAGTDTGVARLPGDLLSAGRQARVRLYVSDGFNEAIITSPPFDSPGVPPQPQITVPQQRGMRVSANSAVNLAGIAWTDARTRLTGRALRWHAGRQLLGFGQQISTTALTAGRHRVTLTARDPDRRTGSTSVTITVAPAPPILSLLKAPKRISAKARSVTVHIATLAADTVKIGRRAVRLGRRPTALRLAVTRGRRTLALILVLRSGSYVLKVPLAIAR